MGGIQRNYGKSSEKKWEVSGKIFGGTWINYGRFPEEKREVYRYVLENEKLKKLKKLKN